MLREREKEKSELSFVCLQFTMCASGTTAASPFLFAFVGVLAVDIILLALFGI